MINNGLNSFFSLIDYTIDTDNYMKIYTKTGDTGETSLFGGKCVAKNHSRIEAYGTVDELNAYIALLLDYTIEIEDKKNLLLIQAKLMTIASILATEKKQLLEKLPKIKDGDVEILESEIDRMENDLPELKSFVLPGGHIAASHCHIARTICRRAERRVISLAYEVDIDTLLIKYLNRLSDYLFTLSRFMLNHFNIKEVEWKG